MRSVVAVVLMLVTLPVAGQQLEVVPVAEQVTAPILEAPRVRPGNPKLDSVLSEVAKAHKARGKAWRQAVDIPDQLSTDDKVLVEIRLKAKDPKGRMARSLAAKRGLEVRNHHVPQVIEAWVPVGQVEALAADPAVAYVRQAELVQPFIGAVNTQEVALSNVNAWHAAGLDGTGVRLGNIDGGYLNFAAAQATGDWPPAAQLTQVNINGGAFGTTTTHGTNTVEINRDMAPAAHIVAYETTTVGDWYNSLTRTPADGVRVASVSLGAPLNGVGDGSNCPPLFAVPCGTIAEAAGIARAGGVLVVNAAGNERNKHWGGLYVPSAVPTLHNWGGGAQVLQSSACVPAGAAILTTLHWDTWNPVNHDYDLEIYRLTAGPAWQFVASSVNVQNGGAGQRPQEFRQVTAAAGFTSPGCPANFTNFGFAVRRFNAPTNRNLQLFPGVPVFNFTAARSLGFPADSPNVYTVSAVDVNTRVQEVYSSEGPVLGAGGGLGASPFQKPDAVSVANVSTFTNGAVPFNGTSAATPHVAGIAAVLLEFNPGLTVNRLQAQLRLIAAANDLAPAGFDTRHGHGLVRLPPGGPAVFDGDGDGIRDDGNGSGRAGDAPCPAGVVVGCDDNCPVVANPTQVIVACP